MTVTPDKRTPTSDERHDLMRAFAMWTSRDDVADELAQQTLLEAWRSDRQPDDPHAWRPWLFGVARNVLLRWRRESAVHGARNVADAESPQLLELAGAVDDLESLLTNSELVAVLDALLARLPSETRDALILKYVEEMPQVEVAARLGVHEKALEGRLHRGKRTLRRFLLTERPDMVVDLGLVGESGVWQEMDLLCPMCGDRHLTGRWFDDGGVRITCSQCSSGRDGFEFASVPAWPRPSRERPRPTLARALDDGFVAWGPAIRGGIETRGHCARCGSRVNAQLVDDRNDTVDDSLDDIHIIMDCVQCGDSGGRHTVSAGGLILPPGRAFWKRHRSIRARPAVPTRWRGVEAFETQWDATGDHRFTSWNLARTGSLLAIEVDGVETLAADIP